jgi:hypothetical protein
VHSGGGLHMLLRKPKSWEQKANHVPAHWRTSKRQPVVRQIASHAGGGSYAQAQREKVLMASRAAGGGEGALSTSFKFADSRHVDLTNPSRFCWS